MTPARIPSRQLHAIGTDRLGRNAQPMIGMPAWTGYVLTAVAVLLLHLVVVPSATARSSDAGPIPTKPIQPGGAVCGVGETTESLPVVGAPCRFPATLNFVFAGDDGSLYIGSAAHAFTGEGDRARIPNDRRPFGTVVFDSDTVDFGHPGTLPDASRLDFALIEIDRSRYRDVEPRVREWGGPTGVSAADDTFAGAAVVAYGNGGAGGVALHEAADLLLRPKPGRRSGELVADADDTFTSTVGEESGDSGMPYLYGPTGEALGVNANSPGSSGYYPTVAHILEQLELVGLDLHLVVGAPGAALAEPHPHGTP
jgi:hypothetical protein